MNTATITFLFALFGVSRMADIPALPIAYSGLPTYYADGVMENVYQNRLLFGDIAADAFKPSCLAALNDDHIGEYIALFYDGKIEVCLVADVAQPEHGKRRNRLGLVVEVDYDTARRLGIEPGRIKNIKVALLPERGSDE